MMKKITGKQFVLNREQHKKVTLAEYSLSEETIEEYLDVIQTNGITVLNAISVPIFVGFPLGFAFAYVMIVNPMTVVFFCSLITILMGILLGTGILLNGLYSVIDYNALKKRLEFLSEKSILFNEDRDIILSECRRRVNLLRLKDGIVNRLVSLRKREIPFDGE